MSNPLTERDLHELRMTMRILNLETLLRLVLRSMASTQPDQKQALQDLASEYLKMVDGMRFPSSDSAHSQMVSDEYREIANEYLGRVLQD